MSCDCGRCRENYRTLGVGYGVPSESEIEEAYKEAVKQWHPDLFENFASLRADAEDRFKLIQVAYRELKEHNTIGGEAPAQSIQTESPAQKAGAEVVRETPAETPSISFDGAPGCLTADQFTQQIEESIAGKLGKLGVAQAIIDLGGGRGYSQFLLLAARGLMMRDARGLTSLLWYTDLGETNLIDHRGSAKPGFWQKLSGAPQGTELQIVRNNGVLFCSLSAQVDDRIKTVVYNFLIRQKEQSKP